MLTTSTSSPFFVPGTRRRWALGAATFLLLAPPALAQTPLVSGLTPARNAVAAPRNTSVALTYSQPLSNTAATQGALKVFSAQTGGQKAGTATVSGNTLRFDPATDFKAGETVLATATSSVQGSDGTPAAPHVFQFTTATAPSTGRLGLTQPVLTTNAPLTAGVGDVDGDGDVDLLFTRAASTSSTSGAITVVTNAGDGTFRFSGLPTGTDRIPGLSGTIALVDLDADGDLDLVASNALGTTYNVLTFRNNGRGLFTAGPSVGVLEQQDGFTTGDVDGDGDQDVVATSLTGVATILTNNGTGTLSPLQTTSLGRRNFTDGSSAALGDVDNDGDLDLLITSKGPASPAPATVAAVGLNNGSGVFTTTGQALVLGEASFKLALGDIDADGDLDVVSAGGVYRNSGNGTFVGSPQAGSRAEAVLGDLDGDGDLDQLVGTSTGATVRLNDGQGVFTDSQVANGGADGLLLADLNDDNSLDLLLLNRSTNAVSVRLNESLPTPPVSSLRLNAGGGAVSTSLGAFTADQYFSANSATTTTPAPIAGTADDALYQSERYSTNGELRYAVPVANGQYTVVLHFAETYWTQPGQRVFNIGLEGSTVRTNYDIVAQAGPLTATTETYPVTVTDGVLNLDLVVPYLSGGRDQAKLSALEILPRQANYRINAGGPSVGTTSGVFAADQYFSANSDTRTTTATISGTVDKELYQSERYSTQGELRYAVPVVNGQYTVILHFAETFWGFVGQRVFNIGLEGTTVRTNYDIVAKVGPLTATTETFPVTVTDGVLNVDLVVPYLSGGRDQAKLSALEILRATGTSRGALATGATTSPGPVRELSAYPNPTATGQFTLTCSAPHAQAGTLTLVDQVGRLVHAQAVQLQAGTTQVSVQLPQLQPGLYQLVLRTEDGQRSTQKLVVQP